jgi:polyisoprenoid-binding protein YceI
MWILHSSASAQRKFSIDPTHSTVSFTLPDVLHTVHGSFTVQASTVSFDRGTGKMGGIIEVDSGSGESGNKVRDGRMRNDELKAKLFPNTTFAPTQLYGKIPSSGEASVLVDGMFTLVGQIHPLEVPLKLHIEGQRCTATGSFVVPYVRWGLKDPSTFILKVATDVTIQVVLQGTLQD